MSNIFARNCSYEKNVIVRSNREYDYFGNVLEYAYFALYSSTSTITQKVLVVEYEYRVRLLHLWRIQKLIDDDLNKRSAKHANKSTLVARGADT